MESVGLYQIDTHRVIEFSEAEILEIAREYRENPPQATFGSGEDRFTLTYRRAADSRPPILASGAAGAIEQAWFHAYIRGYVEEPSNQAMGIAGGITAVDGCVPKVESLSQMHCAEWECEQLLQILRDAGRPGMHLGLLCTASSPGAIMACMRPGLRDPSNTQIGVHVIPEQKIDWNRLVLAKFCEDWGITPWTSCVSVMGGLCRHGPDVAVGLVTNLLSQLAYGHGSLASLFTNRLDGSWNDAGGEVGLQRRLPRLGAQHPRTDCGLLHGYGGLHAHAGRHAPGSRRCADEHGQRPRLCLDRRRHGAGSPAVDGPVRCLVRRQLAEGLQIESLWLPPQFVVPRSHEARRCSGFGGVRVRATGRVSVQLRQRYCAQGPGSDVACEASARFGRSAPSHQ